MISKDVYRKEISHGPWVHSVIHYAMTAPEGTPPGKIRLWQGQVQPVRTPDGERIPTPTLHYPELVDSPASPEADTLDSPASPDAGPVDQEDSPDEGPMESPKSPAAGRMNKQDSDDAGPMDNQVSAEIEPKPAMSELDIPASPSASADFEYLAGQPSPDGSVSPPRVVEETAADLTQTNINRLRPSLMRGAKVRSCRCRTIGCSRYNLGKGHKCQFCGKNFYRKCKTTWKLCAECNGMVCPTCQKEQKCTHRVTEYD